MSVLQQIILFLHHTCFTYPLTAHDWGLSIKILFLCRTCFFRSHNCRWLGHRPFPWSACWRARFMDSNSGKGGWLCNSAKMVTFI